MLDPFCPVRRLPERLDPTLRTACGRGPCRSRLVRVLLPVALLAWGPVRAGPQESAERFPSNASNTAFDTGPATRVLESAIASKAFPGCAVAVGTREDVLWRAAFGRLDYNDGPPARTDTLYDLASLTKVVGTTSVILTLVRDGRLSLDLPVSRILPELQQEGHDSVTVEHLLTHSSGFPAWKPFYREASGYADLLERVTATPLEAAPGTRYRYSDLGFILLGELAARAAAKPLAVLEQERVFDALRLRETMRNPAPGLRPRIAPTERVPEAVASGTEGGPYLHGVVHDENARAAGGITGHAGLFSTVEDLEVFARELLRARTGKSTIFPADLVELFTTRSHVLADSSRALGWGMKTRGGSAGRLLSRESFGHTGYTGTSLWIDPRRELYVILLTNRVHPTRDNLRIRAVRRELADTVTAAFDGLRSSPPEEPETPRERRSR